MVCKHPRTLTSCATIISPLAIIFIVLAFSTDHWVEVDVDRSKLNEIQLSLSNTNQEMARVFHTRHRGILRECYPESSALFLDEASHVMSENCFYISFDDPKGVSVSGAFEARLHMARSVLATFVFGLVGVVVTFFLAIALCFSKHCHVAHAASVTSLLGGIFVLTSIVMFHGTEYMETNKDGNPGEIIFQNTWSKTLQKASHTEYGYSYALAWVGLILAAFDGILFLLTARAIRMHSYDEDDSSDSGSTDRQQVIRKSKSPEVYDNYTSQKGSGTYPVPMTYGYPPYMQSMPAYPALTYGNSVYSMPEGQFRAHN